MDNSEIQEQEKHVEDTHDESSVAVAEEQPSQEETMVPISAVQKERRKRQEVQLENKLLKEQKAKEPEEDLSKYESITREELGQSKQEILRDTREEIWAESFPDKALSVENELEDFIKQRPNLALAIQNSPNRLKEAYELMTALSPKKSTQSAKPRNKDVPASPGTVAKSASLNEGVDVMNMSDSEFRDWRKSKHTRR